jgi:hypothetical protein
MAVSVSPTLKARLEAMPATQAMRELLAYQWGDNVVQIKDTGLLDIDADGNFFCQITAELRDSPNNRDQLIWHCNMKDGHIVWVFAIHERKGYFVGKRGVAVQQEMWTTS